MRERQRTLRFLLVSLLPICSFAQDQLEEEASFEEASFAEEEQQQPCEEQFPFEEASFVETEDEEPSEEIVSDEPEEEMEAPLPRPKWYFAAKPGYCYFTDGAMRAFFDNGGFTVRGEMGYHFWGPLSVWIDGGYFQKKGHAIGGPETSTLMLGTLTLGFKTIFYLHDAFAFYAAAGPRIFMMLMHNDSPFVRSEDNQVGLGGGGDAGFWIFPFGTVRNWARNIFLDLYVDYSWKVLKTQEDEISSEDYDVDVSAVSFGAGLGFRF